MMYLATMTYVNFVSYLRKNITTDTDCDSVLFLCAAKLLQIEQFLFDTTDK